MKLLVSGRNLANQRIAPFPGNGFHDFADFFCGFPIG